MPHENPMIGQAYFSNIVNSIHLGTGRTMFRTICTQSIEDVNHATDSDPLILHLEECR